MFEMEKNTEFNIFVRYPHWAKDGVEIDINGKSQRIDATPGNFLEISRTWKDGDRIDVRMPFSLKRLETMPDDEDRIAAFYGPLLLAGDLGPVDDENAQNRDYVFSGVHV